MWPIMCHKQNEIVVSSLMISLRLRVHLYLANDRCTSSIRMHRKRDLEIHAQD
jgi:hypothetical protein